MKMRMNNLINDMERGWVNGKTQPLWHKKVYRMWHLMWERVYGYENYFGSLIYPKFKYLSEYVKWIESQPRFEEFCSTCHKIMWVIDKDMKVKGNRNYYPEYMTLTTQRENIYEVSTRNKSRFIQRYIVGLADNSILLFKSLSDAKVKGFNPCNITLTCKKKQKSHKGYRWFYVNPNHSKIFRRKV